MAGQTVWPTPQKKLISVTAAPQMIAAAQETSTPSLPRDARCGLEEFAPKPQTIAETIKDAVVVPRRAVMEQQSAKTVYVVKEDKTVEMRTVTLGQRHEDVVVVREGVKAGETVIVDGMMKTRPGLAVVPAEAKKEGKAAEGEGN